MTMAHGDLPRGMAHGGHILLGNHEIARTSGATPVTSSCLVQTLSRGKTGPYSRNTPRAASLLVECNDLMHVREQRHYPPPRGIVASNPGANRCHATQVQVQNQDSSYMVCRLHNASLWADTCCLEAHASEEAGSLSAPRAAMSGSNRAAFKASPHNEKTCQTSVESGNYKRRQRHGDKGIITLEELKHQDTMVP
jgi:hypothetical protein